MKRRKGERKTVAGKQAEKWDADAGNRANPRLQVKREHIRGGRCCAVTRDKLNWQHQQCCHADYYVVQKVCNCARHRSVGSLAEDRGCRTTVAGFQNSVWYGITNKTYRLWAKVTRKQ
jgi:hypothetical protein